MSWRERSAAILKNEAGGEPTKPSKPPVQADQDAPVEVLMVLMVPTPPHSPEIEGGGYARSVSESWALGVAIRGAALCEVWIPVRLADPDGATTLH